MKQQTATQHTTSKTHTKNKQDKTITEQHTKQTNEIDKQTTHPSHIIHTLTNKLHHTQRKEQLQEGTYIIQPHTGKSFKSK